MEEKCDWYDVITADTIRDLVITVNSFLSNNSGWEISGSVSCLRGWKSDVVFAQVVVRGPISVSLSELPVEVTVVDEPMTADELNRYRRSRR